MISFPSVEIHDNTIYTLLYPDLAEDLSAGIYPLINGNVPVRVDGIASENNGILHTALFFCERFNLNTSSIALFTWFKSLCQSVCN